MPFDVWFGTFRDKFKGSGGVTKASERGNEDSESYRGAAAVVTEKEADILDSKADLFAPQPMDYTVYNVLVSMIFLIFALAAGHDSVAQESSNVLSVEGFLPVWLYEVLRFDAHMMGLLVAVGPIACSCVLLVCSSATPANKGSMIEKLRYLLLHPFHEESLLGWLGLHILAGIVLCVLPAYHTVTTLLLPPGQSVGCLLWSC